VWAALQQIPYGETTTYSDIANRINRPAARRYFPALSVPWPR
jgi:methylated-DNA-[protein]-cysteine S-methyltransferase